MIYLVLPTNQPTNLSTYLPTYLFTYAPTYTQTSVREKDISDMIDQVSSQEKMTPEVFDKLREWSLDYMLLEHFADFKVGG